jgi:hypothetical protein
MILTLRNASKLCNLRVCDAVGPGLDVDIVVPAGVWVVTRFDTLDLLAVSEAGGEYVGIKLVEDTSTHSYEFDNGRNYRLAHYSEKRRHDVHSSY